MLFYTNYAYSINEEYIIQNSLLNSILDTLKPGDTTKVGDLRQKEILLENLQDQNDDSELLDLLEYLESNPIDLNTATLLELQQIPFINGVIANNIIKYRTENGKFETKRELLDVEGITDELYEEIKPYVIVQNSNRDYLETEGGEIIRENIGRKIGLIKNFDLRIRSRFLQDLQTRVGFLNGKYLGTKPKVYNQARLTYNHSDFSLEGNVTLEKDAGERKLTDFVSGYLELKNYKFIKSFIIGDYSLNFGQGIGMWNTLSFSKSIDAVSGLKKSGVGLRSYGSVTESQFFRGIATQFSLSYFDFNLFYSDNYYDGSIDTTLNEITSFYFEGYHRTESEINKQNAVKERLFGGNISYINKGIRLGVLYWTSNFSKNIGADSTTQLYSFSGNKANMISFYYDVVFRNMNFYGEFARSQSGAIAGLGAVQFTFYKIADLVLLYRDYPEKFAPVHSFGFGEKSGNTQNERGIYAGITLKPISGLVINSYFDQYKFPYRSYFEPVPLIGNDFLINADWKLTKNLTISAKYRNETKEESRTIKDEFNRDKKVIDARNQLNLRAGFIYEISDRFIVRGRFDYVYVSYEKFGGNNKGFMVFSNFRTIPLSNLVIDFRVIYFKTDSYDSRLYEYENDIKGVMTNLALYGQGRRWYIIAKYKPLKFLEINAKYSETYIDGAKSIGSGYDEILNDINNRLNLGIEINF
ncbi:MAG: helix-hairpin-helix domain-containing protein [Ignavibacteria bacterium]|nr:helix-hairpin-helix domain-containing protein [Ignavibacteria bacterium]